MNEFLFVFRLNLDPQDVKSSPEKMQGLWKAWQDWMGNLTAQNKLGSTGKRLGTEGKVVKPDKHVANGPYVELKEAVAGYMFVKANNLEEAAELAKGCPNLTIGGTVEIRPVVPDNYNG